jgi:PAS domain S-box-containing protein
MQRRNFGSEMTVVNHNYELIESLFVNMSEGIVVCSHEGEIVMLNPAAEKMFGFSAEELKGKPIELLVPQQFRHRHVGHREKFAGNAHNRPMGLGLNLHGSRKDGSEFPVEISLSPVRHDGNDYIIAFVIDITVRKQIEASVQEKQLELERVASALIATNEELERKVNDRTKILQEAILELEKSRNELSQALEKEKDLNDLKSRFISMASHEFRTPLTTILSSASLIAEYNNPGQEEKKLKHVSRIKSAVNNLNDILSDFLSLSKLDEGKVHSESHQFDLKELTDEVINDMQVTVKAGQRIVHTHTGNTLVLLDPKLMRNILINLCSNAIKFTPEQKIITVKTDVASDTVSLEVTDQGIGISEEDQKHLFERFFRGKNATNIQGTGLGLHIVGNYVDLLKGHIMLHSELSKGTTIKITFPIQKV